MKAKTSLAKKGAELVMTNLQPQVKKVFEITGLERVFPLCLGEDEAVEMLS